MKLFKTETTESEYIYIDEIIKEICIKKYFFGFVINKVCTTTTKKIPPITLLNKKTAKMGNIILKVGMRVIVRCNEPEPLMIGKIIGFNNIGREVSNSSTFPEVVDEKDGKEYSVMGIILPYSDTLKKELDKLKTIEQWNYLVGEHGQIEEKYGIKYKTFK